jgi:nucleotide-binding universal stress UspA family protein
MTQDDLPKPSSTESAKGNERPRVAMDESDLPYDRVLVPIDFSEHSKRILSYATKTAFRHNSTIYLLHVFQIPDYVVTPYARQRLNSTEVRLQLNAAEQDARENLDALAQELSNKGIKVLQAYLRVGYPFDEIVLMANHFHVDLIIIGIARPKWILAVARWQHGRARRRTCAVPGSRRKGFKVAMPEISANYNSARPFNWLLSA